MPVSKFINFDHQTSWRTVAAVGHDGWSLTAAVGHGGWPYYCGPRKAAGSGPCSRRGPRRFVFFLKKNCKRPQMEKLQT
jgi:hypothetical protein